MSRYTGELPVKYHELHYLEKRRIRQEYIRRQEGNCYYCKHPLSGPAAPEVLKKIVNRKLFPENFFDWPEHLHHDHNTGLTIGTVHCYCNAVLWQYEGE